VLSAVGDRLDRDLARPRVHWRDDLADQRTLPKIFPCCRFPQRAISPISFPSICTVIGQAVFDRDMALCRRRVRFTSVLSSRFLELPLRALCRNPVDIALQLLNFSLPKVREAMMAIFPIAVEAHLVSRIAIRNFHKYVFMP